MLRLSRVSFRSVRLLSDLPNRITEVKVGNVFKLNRDLSSSDVEGFAKVSGDHNPLHLNPEIAAQSRFGKPIVHGMLAGSIFSAMLGNAIPNSIYLSQNLKFQAPIFVGENVTAQIEVIATRPEKRIATFRTVVLKSNGQVAIEGEAVLLAPETCKVH